MVDRLGSLIVRNLTPGPGYRFDGGSGLGCTPHGCLLRAVDVLDAARVVLLRPASARRAQLRAHARRDPARRHRAPASGQDAGRRAIPDGDRVLRLQRGRTAQPHRRAGGPRFVERSAAPRHLDRRRLGRRAAARLRHRQRPDARHRLLGRRLRPVRPALGLRRLRRRPDRRRAALGAQPQGRHGRDLLFGVLPARGGGHRPAGPGRHHAAQPDRRPVLDRLPRRDLQRRLRRQLDRPARVGRPARARRAANRGRRPRSPRATRPVWPTSACTCRPRASSRSSAPTSAGRRRCSTSARRPCGPRTSRCPCSWSAPSRTSRSVRSGPRSSPRCTATRTSTSP